MAAVPDPETLVARFHALLRCLRGLPTEEELDAAADLVVTLRDVRRFSEVAELAEALGRHRPGHAATRRLYAQALIEQGYATAALDVLQALAGRLGEGDPEFAEAMGLIGRANKQVFFDAGDKTGAGARRALGRAVEVYRRAYLSDPGNTWHGVNLAALLTRGRRLGLDPAPDLDPAEIARAILKRLAAIPDGQRDAFYLPTLAEARLVLGDWDAVEAAVRESVASSGVHAFQVSSTLRQFTEVWDLEAEGSRGAGIVSALRARLASLPGGEVLLSPGDLRRLRCAPRPGDVQLEAVLGTTGPRTYRWWRTGLDRAACVGVVRGRGGGARFGSGFAVRAADFGLGAVGEVLFLTNCHVVNDDGMRGALRPAQAEVMFEAADGNAAHRVSEVLWSSAVDRHDASFLRLASWPPGLDPPPLATTLPELAEGARVYIIGHPGGEELQFSFQDNELLDHEGPPGGTRAVRDVCRVHYRAPTKPGSSGSPVFDERFWEVVALHHAGARDTVARLNGAPGSYSANEGISIPSIMAAVRG